MTQKMDVVKALDEKKTQNEIAKEFGISQTQVSRIKKNKDRIQSEWQSGTHNDRKRKRSGKNKDVEEGLFLWFEQARSKNVPISGPLLIEKCKKIAEAMGSDFEPNAGWLFRWKKRYNLKYKRAHGESGDTDVKGAE